MVCTWMSSQPANSAVGEGDCGLLCAETPGVAFRAGFRGMMASSHGKRERERERGGSGIVHSDERRPNGRRGLKSSTAPWVQSFVPCRRFVSYKVMLDWIMYLPLIPGPQLSVCASGG